MTFFKSIVCGFIFASFAAAQNPHESKFLKAFRAVTRSSDIIQGYDGQEYICVSGNLLSLNSESVVIKNQQDVKLELPKSLRFCTQLSILDLSGTRLGTFPDHVTGVTSLSHLNLSRCGMHYGISSNIGDLTCLEYLNLSDNFFRESVPQSLANLRNLKILLMRNSQLRREFPEAIFRLPCLQILDISKNMMFVTMPSKIISPVVEMRLRQNGQQEKYEDLYHQTDARLDIRGSALNGFFNLKKLCVQDANIALEEMPHHHSETDTLILTGAKFFQTRTHFLQEKVDSFLVWNAVLKMINMQTIRVLDVEDIGLTSPFLDFIPLMPQLSTLNLSLNPLNTEMPSCFSDLQNLERLWLRKCGLSGDFSWDNHTAGSLTLLDIRKNNIDAMNFQGVPEGRTLDVSVYGNPIRYFVAPHKNGGDLSLQKKTERHHEYTHAHIDLGRAQNAGEFNAIFGILVNPKVKSDDNSNLTIQVVGGPSAYARSLSLPEGSKLSYLPVVRDNLEGFIQRNPGQQNVQRAVNIERLHGEWLTLQSRYLNTKASKR